jgi:hypothetical protein
MPILNRRTVCPPRLCQREKELTHLDALALALGSIVISGRPIQLNRSLKYYDSIRAFVPPAGKFIIELRKSRSNLAGNVLRISAFQYQDRISQMADEKPWTFEGTIVKTADTEQMRDLAMHSAIRNCLALRLAIFYDAPLDDLESIVTAGKEAAPGAIGLIYGTEWSFLSTLVMIRTGKAATADAIPEEFARNTDCPLSSTTCHPYN